MFYLALLSIAVLLIPLILHIIYYLKCRKENFKNVVSYSIQFWSDWGKYPDSNFASPPNPHTGLWQFVTHSDKYKMFQVGKLASPGIIDSSENGNIQILQSEFNNGVYSTKEIDHIVKMPISKQSPVMENIYADDKHSLFSFSSMIAPSPDLFFGVDSINLKDNNGKWMDTIMMPVYGYNAGSDSGTKFENHPDYPEKKNKPIEVDTKLLWKNGQPGVFGHLILIKRM